MPTSPSFSSRRVVRPRRPGRAASPRARRTPPRSRRAARSRCRAARGPAPGGRPCRGRSRRLVPLGQGGEDRLHDRSRELESAFFGAASSTRSNSSRSLYSVLGKVAQELADRLLLGAALRLLLAPAAPFFFDCASAWNARSSSRRAIRSGLGLEVQPERPLDGDLAVAEVGGREDRGRCSASRNCRPVAV